MSWPVLICLVIALLSTIATLILAVKLDRPSDARPRRGSYSIIPHYDLPPLTPAATKLQELQRILESSPQRQTSPKPPRSPWTAIDFSGCLSKGED